MLEITTPGSCPSPAKAKSVIILIIIKSGSPNKAKIRIIIPRSIVSIYAFPSFVNNLKKEFALNKALIRKWKSINKNPIGIMLKKYIIGIELNSFTSAGSPISINWRVAFSKK